jgi:hypothetical protein
VDRTGFGRPGDRAHEPGVRRDTFAGSRPLDRRLERLRQAQADPRGELLTDRPGTLVGGIDEDELGLLAGEANLDVAGRQLRVELERGLREQVEELQAQVRAQCVAEPAGDLRRPFVAELGEALQVVLEPFEDDRQIPRDSTMTSLATSVKHQVDVLMLPVIPPALGGCLPPSVRCAFVRQVPTA